MVLVWLSYNKPIHQAHQVTLIVTMIMATIGETFQLTNLMMTDNRRHTIMMIRARMKRNHTKMRMTTKFEYLDNVSMAH